MTSTTQREHTPADSPGVTQLVDELKNLHRGSLALPKVIALGESAVPALEAALRAPSQALPQPRALAADALGAIGGDKADAALTRALEDSTARRLDPSFREAEAVVVSRIVTHLSRHERHEAAEALLESLRERPGSACAEALGELRDPRAIPLLVRSLAEDAAREAAMRALRHFGRAPILRLRAALACPQLTGGIESPTNVDARAAAATLLGELGERAPLLLALDDSARGVRIAAAMALTESSEGPNPRTLKLLVQALDDPDWAVAESVMTVLTHHRGVVESLIDEALEDTGGDENSLRRHRRAAVLAGRLGITHSAPILASLADSPDPALRFAAIHALSQVSSATDEELAGFLADCVLGVALTAYRALEQRRPVTMREVTAHLKRTPHFRSPWRRWKRLWVLRSAAR
jgi:HEAT repeat protein